MAAANNRVILLGRLLKRVDNFNVASFKDRLTFQKTVYLLQASGVFLGYSFNWYLHGPYSSVLARDGFQLSTIYDGLESYRFRDPKTEAAFDQFREFINEHRDEADWLEAAASIHFLRRTFPHESKPQTKKRVMAKGEHLSPTLFEGAWRALVGAKLITDLRP
jgi:uncharacterized protein YwgA